MNKLNKVLLNSGTVLFFVMCAVLLVLGLPSSGHKALSVQTGSMKPSINPGDLVLVNRVATNSLKAGDVITYVNQDKKATITHRIVQKNGLQNGPKQFITKGDANSKVDAPVSENKVVGKVNMAVPKLGYAFDFMRQPLGLILLIYIPALIVIWNEIKRLTEYYKSMEPYVAAGAIPKLIKRINWKPMGKVLMLMITTVALVIAGPIYALLNSTATLTSNTISTTGPAGHLLVQQVIFSGGSAAACTPPNTNASITNTGPGSANRIINRSLCRFNNTNNTVVNININNSQTATTGNANGNNATSGNATNNSSTVINFNVNNGGSAPNQAVVLFNPTSSPINLAGWTLTDNNGQQNIPTTAIVAGGFVTILWPVTDGLAKLGDRMILKNPSAAEVDSVSWGSDLTELNPSVTTTGSTTSIIRSPASLDTNSSADWVKIP